jgi:hypothetical protein
MLRGPSYAQVLRAIGRRFLPLRKQLLPSEKDNFPCYFEGLFQPLPPVKNADITLIISFHTYFNRPKTKSFRFVTKKGKDNQLYWYPRALD